MDQSLLVLLKWYTSVSLQFQISVKEVRQVQNLYLFIMAWMTPFFHANLCSPKATLCSMCPTSSRLQLCRVCPVLLPRLRPFLFFSLLRRRFWHTRGFVAQRDFLPCGLCAEQMVPLCRRPIKASFFLLRSHLSPGFTWGGGEASTSALYTAGLVGRTSARPQKHQIQSNRRGVCTVNERLWPTSYSIIGFGLVYMGRLHQFNLSLFFKVIWLTWCDLT